MRRCKYLALVGVRQVHSFKLLRRWSLFPSARRLVASESIIPVRHCLDTYSGHVVNTGAASALVGVDSDPITYVMPKKRKLPMMHACRGF